MRSQEEKKKWKRNVEKPKAKVQSPRSRSLKVKFKKGLWSVTKILWALAAAHHQKFLVYSKRENMGW